MQHVGCPWTNSLTSKMSLHSNSGCLYHHPNPYPLELSQSAGTDLSWHWFSLVRPIWWLHQWVIPWHVTGDIGQDISQANGMGVFFGWGICRLKGFWRFHVLAGWFWDQESCEWKVGEVVWLNYDRSCILRIWDDLQMAVESGSMWYSALNSFMEAMMWCDTSTHRNDCTGITFTKTTRPPEQ